MLSIFQLMHTAKYANIGAAGTISGATDGGGYTEHLDCGT